MTLTSRVVLPSAAEDSFPVDADALGVQFDSFTFEGQDFTSVEVDLSTLLEPTLAEQVKRAVGATCSGLELVDEWVEDCGDSLRYYSTYAAGEHCA